MHSYIPFIWHRAVQLVFANMGIPKREWFCMWWPQTVALSSSYLTDSSLLLCFASALVTTGSMRRYLQPNQVAQLLQDGTTIWAVARRFAVSLSTVSRAWEDLGEPVLTAQHCAA